MSRPSSMSDCPFEFLGVADDHFDYNRLSTAVDSAVNEIGRESDLVGHSAYLAGLRAGMRVDESSGIRYLLIGPPDPRTASPDRLIMLSTPFGKQPSELVVIAQLMQRLSNVLADGQGRVPALLLAGPPDWNKLPRKTKDQLRDGELGGLAAESLRLVRRIPETRNVGLIAGIGFSYAASLTSAVGCGAMAEGFDIGGISMASPGDTVRRGRVNLFKSFRTETQNALAHPYKVGNPQIFNVANDVGDVEFWISLVRNAPQNLRLMAALAVGNFMHRLHDFDRLHPTVPATVTHGSGDLITPHGPISASFGDLRSRLNPDSNVRWLVAKDARHPWGHSARMLGVVVRYGFERMATAT